MKKSYIVVCTVFIVLLVGVVAYVIFYSSNFLSEKKIVSSTIATTTVATATLSDIESSTTPIVSDKVFLYALAKSGLKNYSSVPVDALNPIQLEFPSRANEYVQALYRIDGVTFDVAPIGSSPIANTIDLNIDFDPVFGVDTFTYQGGQYFMFSGIDCGTGGCTNWLMIYLSKNRTLTRIASLVPHTLFDHDHFIVRAVLVVNGNAYVFISHFTSTTSIILDSSGNLVNTVTSTDGSPAEPSGILPSDLATLLQSIAS